MIKIVMIIILLFILSYILYYLEEKLGRKKTFFIYFLILVLSTFFLPKISDSISSKIDEFMTPKPNIEVYLTNIKTINSSEYNEWPDFNGDIFYISGCEKSGMGVLNFLKNKYSEEEKEGYSIGGLNNIGRGCDSCGYYTISYKNFGELPKQLKIEGEFISNHLLIKEIIPSSGTNMINNNYLTSNSFILVNNNIQLNLSDNRLATIITEKESDLRVNNCLIDDKRGYCTIQSFELDQLWLNRTKYGSIRLRGRSIKLPPLTNNSFEIYKFNIDSFDFQYEESSGKVFSGEGNPC